MKVTDEMVNVGYYSLKRNGVFEYYDKAPHANKVIVRQALEAALSVADKPTTETKQRFEHCTTAIGECYRMSELGYEMVAATDKQCFWKRPYQGEEE